MARQIWDYQCYILHIPGKLLLLPVAIVAIIGGATIWILNIESIIRGPWSTVMTAVFTVLSVLLTFLQWHSSSPERRKQLKDSSDTPLEQREHQRFYCQGLNLRVSKRKGALVVKTKKHMRGITIHLFRGFESTGLKADMACNIVECTDKGYAIFAGVFPSLEPGNYTIHIGPQGRTAEITIYSGHITEVDWR